MSKKNNENSLSSRCQFALDLLEDSFSIVVFDAYGYFLYANEAFKEKFHFSTAIIGLHWSTVNVVQHSTTVALWEDVLKGKRGTAEAQVRLKNDETVWLTLKYIPFYNTEQQRIEVLAILIEEPEMKVVKDWRHLATHHELTDLPNRRKLQESLEILQARAHMEQLEFAVFFMDINQFKTINDTYGHSVGDLVLLEVANRLKTIQTHNYQVYHIGGDEFLILSHSIDKIEQNIEKILSLFIQPFVYESIYFKIDMSIGASICPKHGKNLSQLIELADVAMFEVKSDDQLRYKIYDQSSSEDCCYE